MTSSSEGNTFTTVTTLTLAEEIPTNNMFSLYVYINNWQHGNFVFLTGSNIIEGSNKAMPVLDEAGNIQKIWFTDYNATDKTVILHCTVNIVAVNIHQFGLA